MQANAYAVLGHPVAHSLSPRIHAAFAAQTGDSISYRAIDVPDELSGFLDGPEGRDLAGANVTLPHKQAALRVVTRASDRARRAGAVNTLLRDPDGSWTGENTDGEGLVRDLTGNLGRDLEGCRILVLGAGGATRGILGPLLAARPAKLTVANRTEPRAVELASAFGIEAAPLAGLAGRWDAVINATSAGHDGTGPDLPGVRIARGGWAYDLSYGTVAEPFLAWAARAGACAWSDGLGMLVEQAALSFELWRGRRPRTAPVLASLRTAG